MPESSQATNVSSKSLRSSKQFKQRLLTANAKRMLVFCAVYVALSILSLIFINTPLVFEVYPHYFSVGWLGFDIMLVMSVVAIGAGVVMGALCALVVFGFVRSPRTQNFIVQASLIVLCCVQLVVCSVELNVSALIHNYLIFILMLGVIPLMSRVKSTLYIVGFVVLCWLSFFLIPLFFASTPLGEFLTLRKDAGEYAAITEQARFFVQVGPVALVADVTEPLASRGLVVLLPAVIFISLGASWFNYGQAQRTLVAELELEELKNELDTTVETRIAEFREEARKAEASNRAKTRFLTRVSHEMRTSMTTISGMAFLAKESEDPVSRQENLEAISEASQKLKTVVDNILDTTKIETNFDEEDFDEDFALLSSDTSQPERTPVQVDPPDLSGKTILIVEDLPTNRLVLSEFLKKTHATIEEAENGREAVEMFSTSSENYYSFIFMDLLMPEMNGHDATRAIRKMERSDALSIPIVAVSANAFSEDIEASLAAGMDAHIAKPIEQSTIFSTLIERLT